MKPSDDRAIADVRAGRIQLSRECNNDPGTLVRYLQNLDKRHSELLYRSGFPGKANRATNGAVTSEVRVLLETEFEQAMHDTYDRAKREVGYQANRFLEMLHERGGVRTAHDLLASKGGSDGFTKLWELHRLDLSVEALVLKDRWSPLFSDTEKKEARKRLDDVGYRIS